jgi:hypothetical protein
VRTVMEDWACLCWTKWWHKPISWQAISSSRHMQTNHHSGIT